MIFYTDGMPHVILIDRKPKGVGCELKNSADADTKIILQLEIQEGADIMSSKEYMSEYKPCSLGLPSHGMDLREL